MTDPLLLSLCMAAGISPPRLNPTPHEVVFTEHRSRLLRFAAPGGTRGSLFLCYALINRFHILDLVAGRSVVEALARRGLDVYLLDWGVPDREDRLLPMEHYVDGILARALRAALSRSGAKAMPLAGYCMGGTMAAMAAALHPERASALVTVAAPIDFAVSSDMARWTGPEHFPVEAIVGAVGNVPGSMIQSGFLALQPTANARKYARLARLFNDPQAVSEFVALESWATDQVPFPGEFYRKYIRDLYQEDRLARGVFELGGRRVDLSRIKCPVLVVSASQDPIVSPASSEALLGLVGSSRKEKMVVRAGHIGIAVSERNMDRVWGRIADFALEAS